MHIRLLNTLSNVYQIHCRITGIYSENICYDIFVANKCFDFFYNVFISKDVKVCHTIILLIQCYPVISC